MGGPNRTEDIDFVKWKREISPPQESHRRNLCWNRTTKIEWHDVRAARVALANSTNGSYTTKPATLTVCCAMFCFVSFRCFHFYWMCVRVRRYTCELWLGISFIHTAPHTLTPLVFSKILLLLTAYLFDVILLWLLLFSYFFSSTIKINTLGCVAIWMQLSVSMIEKAIETF